MDGMEGIGARLDGLDWAELGARVDEAGWASLPPLLARGEADRLIALYGDEQAFRTTVTMARHGFGRGEYRYFRYPLPDIVQELRALLYGRLIAVANRWRSAAGQPPLPETHADYLALCRDAGQTRPTPLLLRYGPGDHNNLHQDLYGDLCFPLQAVFLLSARGDFEGGELILTEQRPRMQSRVHAVPLEPLGGAVFACARRPVRGLRGPYHVVMRHGVSTVRRGSRHSLGIIIHDAS
jgi:hypothetical protein